MEGHEQADPPVEGRQVTDLLAAILSDPGRVAEIPDQEVRGLLLKVAGLLTALSTKVPASASGADQAEADRLLNLPEVAERLGVPRGYAYELARRGQLPTVRFGKYVRVSLADLQTWVAQHHEKGLDRLYTPSTVQPTPGTTVTGKELRGIRKRLGLTQVALAEQLAVTPTTVARWERDEVPIRESMARLIQLLTNTRRSPNPKRRAL
jgi:excisionase family DNA binding protein